MAAEHKVIYTVARLSEEKSILYLIDALEIVARATPSVRLLLVGEGPLRKTIQENSKLSKHPYGHLHIISYAIEQIINRIEELYLPAWHRSDRSGLQDYST